MRSTNASLNVAGYNPDSRDSSPATGTLFLRGTTVSARPEPESSSVSFELTLDEWKIEEAEQKSDVFFAFWWTCCAR